MMELTTRHLVCIGIPNRHRNVGPKGAEVEKKTDDKNMQTGDPSDEPIFLSSVFLSNVQQFIPCGTVYLLTVFRLTVRQVRAADPVQLSSLQSGRIK
jgi:hypothetical protein